MFCPFLSPNKQVFVPGYLFIFINPLFQTVIILFPFAWILICLKSNDHILQVLSTHMYLPFSLACKVVPNRMLLKWFFSSYSGGGLRIGISTSNKIALISHTHHHHHFMSTTWLLQHRTIFLRMNLIVRFVGSFSRRYLTSMIAVPYSRLLKLW